MASWILVIGWLSRSVLVLLLGLSVWSVATMIQCSRSLRKAKGSSEEDPMGYATRLVEKREWNEFRKWAETNQSIYGGTAKAILNSQEADRAVRSFLGRERTRLEQGMTVLATLGSNAPFIGLFGTVLGIIQAFGALGAHQSNTAEIMIGISEALIATAVGLFVAIPAVVAFNIFSRQLRVILVNSEALKDLYLSHMTPGSKEG